MNSLTDKTDKHGIKPPLMPMGGAKRVHRGSKTVEKLGVTLGE